jgi:hypothetical protein
MDELIPPIILIVLYFIPTAIASVRNHNNITSIFILNIFLGWTVLGWVGALIWSFGRKTQG